MALLDDLLRMFGTSRVRLRWRWDRFKEWWNRPDEPRVDRPKIAFKPKRQRGQALAWLVPDEFPLVTVGYLASCVMMFLLVRKALHDAGDDMVARAIAIDHYGIMFGPAVRHGGEWWRLVTANFLHVDTIHLIFNCLGLWTLGQLAEQTFGRGRTVFVLLVSGVAGFLVSAWANDFAGASLGASAAIFGLMGTLVAHGLWRRGRHWHEVKDRLIPWLLYSIIFSFVPRVDGWAHLGGGVAGALLGLVLAEKDKVRKLPGAVWGVIALACLGVVGFSFYQQVIR